MKLSNSASSLLPPFSFTKPFKSLSLLMQPSEVKGLNATPQKDPAHYFSAHYLDMHPYEQDLSNLHSFTNELYHPPYFNTFSINPNQFHQHHYHNHNNHHHPLLDNSSSDTSSLSNKNSNSNYELPPDIKEDRAYNTTSINHERKLKRLISNRESARRSRMRKRKQLEELQLQVMQLQNLYHKLTEKFINLLEHNHQILQDNAQLKEENLIFQKIIDSSDQFVSSSMDLLH